VHFATALQTGERGPVIRLQRGDAGVVSSDWLLLDDWAKVGRRLDARELLGVDGERSAEATGAPTAGVHGDMDCCDVRLLKLADGHLEGKKEKLHFHE